MGFIRRYFFVMTFISGQLINAICRAQVGEGLDTLLRVRGEHRFGER